MADMIKFYKGLVGSLPATGTNGALYITTDEGGIYLGTGTGMKRLGDFVQVDNVASLPEKAHENCLYYCVAENILAKWNGTEWKQVNKQPTTEELKTLLGLGTLAYKSEVAEGDLNADLKAKVNAAAEGNHSHDNKALLDTYTQTEANLADAVAKKHAHANADELAKIADGDKAKWDAVAADHLTSADKTTLENSIKEAKKAGTDANTALETYKVSNDARVLAVEEDIAEITNADNGILAQAKTYADGKDTAIAEAKAAGTTAQSNLEAYQTSNNEALAGVKATADAAAVKTEVETALAGKVDKVEGKSLVSDTEIARLGAMSDGANKVEASTVNGKIKIDGVETTVYTHPAEHAISEITGLQDALDGKQAAGDYATKAEAQGYANAKDEAIAAAKKAGEDAQADVDNLEAYVGTFTASEGVDTVVKYIDAKTANIASDETVGALADRVEQAEKDIDAIEADYLKAADKTELSDAISAEKTRAEGIEGGLRTDVDAIKADYLKAADKTALQEQITTNANAIERLTNGVSADEIDGVNDLIEYVNEHGTEVTGMKEDIKENADAIAAINNETTGILAKAKEHADGLNTAMDARVAELEAIDHDAYVAADTALKGEIVGTADDASSANTINGAKKYAEEKAAAAQSAAESTASGALASAKTELEGKITDGDAATLASAKEDAAAKVKELADGAVADNAAAIEDINSQLEWGTF